MSYNRSDLRSFLAETDAKGLTLYIDKPVDVQTQIAALCSETTLPTVFRNLKGFEDFQLVDGLTRFRETQAMAMGIDSDQPELVMSSYLKGLSKGPGSTVSVDNAPIKEVIWKGDDADLSRLPIPIPTEGVDMPHLDLKADDFLIPTVSGGIVVTRHPNGQHNTFFTMAQVHGNKRMHCFVYSRHTWANIQAWASKGEKCPMAFVIGCHPLYELGAAYTGPHEGFSELHIVSSLFGEPIPTIKAETVDLDIPALAEIVIEGYIDPEKATYLHVSSHSDSYSPIFSSEPFFDVTAITMREKPIYRHIQPNRFTEHHSFIEFIAASGLLKAMLDANLPVKDIHFPVQSCGNCAIVQVRAESEEQVRKVMQMGMQNPMAPRLTIVVDEDVNIYDMGDVMFALSIRTKGKFGLDTLEGVPAMAEPLTTLVNSRTDVQPIPNNRWAVDATKPPLSDGKRRLESVRLTPRGESVAKLADFID